MKNLVYLRLKCVIVVLVVVTKGKYSDSRYKIKIFFSVYIIKIYALSSVEDDLITVICMKQCLLGLFYVICHCLTHFRFSLLIKPFFVNTGNIRFL